MLTLSRCGFRPELDALVCAKADERSFAGIACKPKNLVLMRIGNGRDGIATVICRPQRYALGLFSAADD